MSFESPYWLLLLCLIPAAWVWKTKMALSTHTYTYAQPANQVRLTWRAWLRKRLLWLRWAALAALIVALARPQKTWEEQKVTADALDIMLAIDISPSMLSLDFKPDRLAVAKRVLFEFAEKRPYDRLGLVAFSAEAFTRCPLTPDRRMVQSFITTLETGRIDDGTAIGTGLATALNQLKDSQSKTKIVILITDGENNAGYISPEMATEMASNLGIRVYTVGIGTDGVVMAPASRSSSGQYEFAPRYMTFDMGLLESIADNTGGKFYRAFSAADLDEIYATIDKLEKTKVETKITRHFTDYFYYLLGFSLCCLTVEYLLRWGYIKSLQVD